MSTVITQKKQSSIENQVIEKLLDDESFSDDDIHVELSDHLDEKLWQMMQHDKEYQVHDVQVLYDYIAQKIWK